MGGDHALSVGPSAAEFSVSSTSTVGERCAPHRSMRRHRPAKAVEIECPRVARREAGLVADEAGTLAYESSVAKAVVRMRMVLIT